MPVRVGWQVTCCNATRLQPSYADRFCGGCSSVGRAPDCDSGGRGFDPHQPPHFSDRLEESHFFYQKRALSGVSASFLLCRTSLLFFPVDLSSLHCRLRLISLMVVCQVARHCVLEMLRVCSGVQMPHDPERLTPPMGQKWLFCTGIPRLSIGNSPCLGYNRDPFRAAFVVA